MNSDIENLQQENPLFNAPYLIFDEKERQEAREKVLSLGGSKSEGEERYEVIELVIQNGLYEYYPSIPELSNLRKINKIFNHISSKEETPEEYSIKNIELRRFYWKHVLYPEVVRQICNDEIFKKDRDIGWTWISIQLPFNPSDIEGQQRLGYLADLIRYYKSSETEGQREMIKRFLARQVGDYPVPLTY